MADPTIQTFCCHHRNHSSSAVRLMSEFNKDSYLFVCLFSSALGIIGSLYQIFVRNEPRTIENDGRRTKIIGRKIIIWLAVADLCASVGIFIRSAIWRYFQNLIPTDDDTSSVLFCALSSAWTQYFYTCTWLWTFCYALDVRRTLKKEPPTERLYHLATWTISAVLTAVGLSVLYVPDANCHEISYLSTALIRVLPNYCATYLPIAIIMLVNPILYFSSCKEIDRQLTLTLNQVTAREREVMRVFKCKYFLINFVFYFCWLPNIISGTLLWTLWHSLPVEITIATWYFMAFTNPLQAFFNAFVYRKWTCSYSNRRTCIRSPVLNIQRITEPTERSPFLKFSQEEQQTPSTSRQFIQEIESIPSDNEHSVNSCSCL